MKDANTLGGLDDGTALHLYRGPGTWGPGCAMFIAHTYEKRPGQVFDKLFLRSTYFIVFQFKGTGGLSKGL